MRSLYKVLIIVALLLIPTMAARAEGGWGVDQRIVYTEQGCLAYIWRLMSWETFEPVCSFWLYDDGPPTASEVRAFCGAELSTAWYQTGPISPAGEAPSSGYYVLLDKTAFLTCKTPSHLPPVKFNYSFSGNNLIIEASEPLPDQQITRIEARIGEGPIECLGDRCEVLIVPTGPRGVEVKFWAFSTYSDLPTPTQTIYVRRNPPAYAELVDDRTGTAAQIFWGSFLDPEQPDWLSPAAQPSAQGLAYLAGRLILSGKVDTSSCPGQGLIDWGYANVCGLDLAWPLVLEYQNSLDDQITQAAAEQGIPGQLLKRVIAIESQFWPDSHINWGAAGEAGLGQLTHNGADTLLMWDSDLYEALCWPLFGSECEFNYYHLDSWQQAALQNEVMANPDLEILARALRANAGQAGGIIREITGDRPGAFMDHEDLWKAALVNYNAGPGCLRWAVRDLIKAGYKPSWGALATSLGALCPAAVDYVDQVTATPLPYRPRTGH